MKDNTRRILALVLLLTTVAHARTLPSPVGDEPGEYYRARKMPAVPRVILPVKDKTTHLGLRSVAQEDDRTVRAKVMEALAVIADANDASLVEKLTDDPVPEVRLEALKALARISGIRFERTAGERLEKDESVLVRRTAAALLGELRIGGVYLAATLDDADSSVREAAVRGLGLVGGRAAADNLPKTFEDRSPAVRAACAKALVDAEVAGAQDHLVAGLSDPEEIVRGACAAALGRLGPKAASRIEKLLNSRETRYVLQCTLNSLGKARAADTLPSIHRMFGHEDMGVRTAACNACGAIAKPSSAGHLGKLLPDEHYHVRHAASAALIEIGGRPGGDVLCGAMAHKLAIARREAAWGLGKLRDQESLSLLCKAMGDEDEEVRIISAWALGRLANTGGSEALHRAASDESARVRTEVARSLAPVDTPEGRSILVRLLDDKDPKARSRAARSIGELKHAVPLPLIRTLNDYHTSSRVREDAAWALGEIKAAEAIPHLKKLLLYPVIPVPMMPPQYDSDSTRIQIMKSLVKIGHEGLAGDMIGRFSDENFPGGYWLKKAIADTLTQLTGTRYDFKKSGPGHRRWFIGSIRTGKKNFTYDPNRKPDPIIFPVK